MHINEFNDILHRECANCAKSFGDVSIKHKNQTEWSTTLELSNIGFLSPPEDLTIFLALCYVYQIPPIRFESSIKKYLKTFTKQNPNKFDTLENADKKIEDLEDPLSSLDLVLCQACSNTLGKLYTIFYKFEQLSKKNSFIAKGVLYSKDFDSHEDFILNKSSKTQTTVQGSPKSFETFSQTTIENSQDLELNFIKEELDSDSLFERSFASSEEEQINNDDEEHEYKVDFNVTDNWNNTPVNEIATRRTTRSTSKSFKQSELSTKIDRNNGDLFNLIGSNKYSSLEESDGSTSDVSNKRKSKTGKRNIKSAKVSRKSKRAKREENSSTANTVRYRSKLSRLYSLKCISCKIHLSDITSFKRHHQSRHNIVWSDHISLEKWMELCAEKCYNCDICDEFYISKKELISHLITHYKTQPTITECKDVIEGPPFICSQCDNSDKNYDYWEELQLHGFKSHKISFKKRSSESNPKKSSISTTETYFCSECDLQFKLSNRWAVHMKQLHQVIGCCSCRNTFPNEQLLHLHIKNEHAKEKSTPVDFNIVCENCDEKFPNVKILWMHTLVHIAEDKKNVPLQTFEEFSAKLKDFKIEEKNENETVAKDQKYDVKIYQCLKCKKAFRSFYAMKIHALVHTVIDFHKLKKEVVSVRDFHCPECALDCKRNIILREHCLSEHQIIISTKTYSAEQFLEELQNEKEEGNKRLKLLGLGTNQPETNNKQQFVCNKCSKVFNSFYNRRIHELAGLNDISKMESEAWTGSTLKCPKCKFSLRGNKLSMGMRIHYLSKHNLLLSLDATDLEIFTQRLIDEKEYCLKNQVSQTNHDKDIIVNRNQDPIKEVLNENNDDPSMKKSRKRKPRYITKQERSDHGCYRCNKDCRSWHRKRLHEISHTLDINSLEQEEVYKETRGICPRCGIHFKSSSNPGLYKLKLHCIQDHNLIVSQGADELEKFVEYLQKEKEHCDKNKCVQEVKKSHPKTKITNSRGFRKRTDKTYLCSLCSKKCPTQLLKKFHELAHTIDLATVEEESVPGTHEFTCPRCARKCIGAMVLRLHCLKMHNVIASTETYPASKFIKLLTEEKQLIEQTETHKNVLEVHTDNQPEIKEARKDINSQECPQGIRSEIDKDNTVRTESEKAICNICGKVTKNKHALSGHKVMHEVEKKFICERCGATFRTANLFRSHKRTHFEKDNGIRPSCDICGKSFVSSRRVFQHKANYHPKKRLICPICNKTFASNRYASIHIKKHKSAVASS